MIESHLQLYNPFALSKGNGPVYKQLATFLAGLIRSSILPPGERLPSERELAIQLGLSRTTVTAAYGEVIAMGLAMTHVGKGTFVAFSKHEVTNLVPPPPPWAQPPLVLLDHLLSTSTLPPYHEPRLISFAAGMPAPEALPAEMDEIIHHIVTAHPAGAFGSTPAAGLPELRKQLAQWMMPYALIRTETVEEVVVTTGAQQALDLVTRFFLHPGDTVLVERPTALGALQLFKAYGAHVLDSDLTQLVLPPRQQKPRFFYVMPTWQNPSGRCLSHEELLSPTLFETHDEMISQEKTSMKSESKTKRKTPTICIFTEKQALLNIPTTNISTFNIKEIEPPNAEDAFVATISSIIAISFPVMDARRC